MLKEQFFQPYLGPDIGYVLLIARVKGQVVVIRKNRPAWQAGRINFPGGKIEPNESPLEAAVREMAEETGVALTMDQLRPVGLMAKDGAFAIFAFAAESDDFSRVQSLTDEEVSLLDVSELSSPQCLDSLAWLYDRAFNGHSACERFEFR
jgi:8-oxo-dGTP diphosphatase